MIRAVSSPRAEAEDSADSLYWALLEKHYGENDHVAAKAIADRLLVILAEDPSFRSSIRGEEIRSIAAELDGNLTEAIEARQAEIRKILELHTLSVHTKSWAYVEKQYDFSDVGDRLDLLALLYDDQGSTHRAIDTLLESKEYCQARGIPFDGQDILDELTASVPPAAESASKKFDPTRIDAAIRNAYRRLKVPADRLLVDRRCGRQLLDLVKKQLKQDVGPSITQVMERLLALRKRGSKPNGLPKLNKK